MKRNFFFLLSLLVLGSLMLAACGPKVTEAPATEAPATEAPATEAPATEAPTAEPTPVPDIPIATFDGTSLSVPAEECGGKYVGEFQSIVATDAHTVTFTLCRPDPAFLYKVAFADFSIYPSGWIESTTGDGTRTSEGLEHPVGTGPYMISEWNRGDSLTLTANPDYWGKKAKAKTLVFRWSTESAARLNELQAGTIDGFDNVGTEDFDKVKSDTTLQLVGRPALTIFYVGMTNTFPPFDNQKVRQAIAMGIDRKRIVDNFYPLPGEPGGSTVADYFTPCIVPNGCVGDPWYEFDPTAAKALLAEAGFPDGFKTKLAYRDVVRPYLPQVANVAQDIQQQLKNNLNIDAEIEVMESGAFLETTSAGRLDGLYLLGWTGDYPQITNFLDYHFSCANTQFGTQSETYCKKLVEGAQIADPAKAKPVYTEANNAIRDFVPMVPISHGASATAYKADVKTPQASPLGNELFYVTDPGGRDILVWMQNAEPISLFCADEDDGESIRACIQVNEALYSYSINGTDLLPSLAESCDPNADLTVWTCKLRQGVKFHDGTDFDATDVVATYNMGLNIGSKFHAGNTNLWDYYDYLWGLMKKPGS